jgi:serine/threonine protein kinase
MLYAAKDPSKVSAGMQSLIELIEAVYINPSVVSTQPEEPRETSHLLLAIIRENAEDSSTIFSAHEAKLLTWLNKFRDVEVAVINKVYAEFKSKNGKIDPATIILLLTLCWHDPAEEPLRVVIGFLHSAQIGDWQMAAWIIKYKATASVLRSIHDTYPLEMARSPKERSLFLRVVTQLHYEGFLTDVVKEALNRKEFSDIGKVSKILGILFDGEIPRTLTRAQLNTLVCDILTRRDVRKLFLYLHTIDPAFVDPNSIDILMKSNKTPLIAELFCVMFKAEQATSKSLAMLLQFTDPQLYLGLRLARNLQLAGQLQHTTMQRVIHIVTTQLPSVTESSVTKISRKLTQAARSQLQIRSETSDDVRVYVEHNADRNSYPAGSFSIVKRGYEEEASKIPQFAVKKLRHYICDDKNRPCTLETRLADAKREAAAINYVLRQPAYFFRHHEHVFVVSPWLQGNDLRYTLQNLNMDFALVPIENRLQSAHCLLYDLNLLHERYLLHRDIKPRNCIYNPVTHALHLCDYAGVSKMYSQNTCGVTAAYRDGSGRTYSFCDDIFSAGLVLANLFPELFVVDKYELSPKNEVYRIRHKQKSSLSIVEQAVKLLIMRMNYGPTQRELRCSCRDALDFIAQVLKESSGLSVFGLQKIAAITINRAEATVENTLHGAMTPKMLKS